MMSPLAGKHMQSPCDVDGHVVLFSAESGTVAECLAGTEERSCGTHDSPGPVLLYDRKMVHFYCVLVAAILPYIATGIAKSRRYSLGANHAPRGFLENRTGYQKRAHWAQQNSFEAFPIFAASVIIAHLRDVDESTLASLAIAFVVIRALYIAAYVFDRPNVRSLLWTLGYSICVAMHFL